MLIELHIRRVRKGKAGTDINFGKTTYRFEPNPDLTKGDDEAHVCEISDPAHVATLLSITEAYTEYGDELTEPEPEPEPEPVEEIPDEPSDADLLQEEEDYDIEMQMCETLVGMKVNDAKAQLPGLSDKALSQFLTMERAGQARTTLLAAIQEQQESRKTDPL